MSHLRRNSGIKHLNINRQPSSLDLSRRDRKHSVHKPTTDHDNTSKYNHFVLQRHRPDPCNLDSQVQARSPKLMRSSSSERTSMRLPSSTLENVLFRLRMEELWEDEGYYIGYMEGKPFLTYSRSYVKKLRRPLRFKFSSLLDEYRGKSVFGPCEIFAYDEHCVELGVIRRNQDGWIYIAESCEDAAAGDEVFFVSKREHRKDDEDDVDEEIMNFESTLKSNVLKKNENEISRFIRPGDCLQITCADDTARCTLTMRGTVLGGVLGNAANGVGLGYSWIRGDGSGEELPLVFAEDPDLMMHLQRKVKTLAASLANETRFRRTKNEELRGRESACKEEVEILRERVQEQMQTIESLRSEVAGLHEAQKLVASSHTEQSEKIKKMKIEIRKLEREKQMEKFRANEAERKCKELEKKGTKLRAQRKVLVQEVRKYHSSFSSAGNVTDAAHTQQTLTYAAESVPAGMRLYTTKNEEYKKNREKLYDFYSRHNSEKLSSVDSILTKYKGREKELFSALRKRYPSEKNNLRAAACESNISESEEKE
eukprot:g3238.t1